MPSVIYEIAGILAFMLALALYQVAMSSPRLCLARTRPQFSAHARKKKGGQQACISPAGSCSNHRRGL
ncbi:hypothetical protein ACPA2N_22040 [Ectopseudomonas hydrolytica]|uniref:hypothetical protein n=1 Tax=Ectopseudomonas hydrolytica TaxID=2493633 RepID=UPI000C27D93D|nr:MULTISPECIES: hypothetical protein [unclassified Pseudomonas]MBI6905408.1 hypothetical protein [Pseudomonas aeruginosa]HBO7921699.1 hypothetical protein [Pseudomonas aeruginosa]